MGRPCTWLFLLLAVTLTAGQVLNGYINPLWMADSRGRGRSIGNGRDFYVNTGGIYSADPRTQTGIYRADPRTTQATALVYLDEEGRYRPVYRQDRVFQANQNYYRVNEPQQFLPVVPSAQPIITTV